jgi:hypothetical protein
MVYGSGFLRVGTMVRFTCKGIVHKFAKPVYKTSKKIAVEIPDMGTDVEIGNH